MKVYRTDEIRNVVLLGHGGCGKTTLAEAMAYLCGVTKRMGTIQGKNTISDFDKEEQKREFSISTSMLALEWEKEKINVLDTPGYLDFCAESEEAVRAADAAIIVVSGKAGVEVGTQRAWDLCEKYHMPRMIFVTEMDLNDASFRQVVEDLTALYGKKIAPVVQPIREAEHLVGYVNVVKSAGRRFTETGNRVDCEIPDYCMANYQICRDALMESVAETSEDMMERYFAGEEFSVEEIRSALYQNVAACDMVPVYMGSGISAHGVQILLSDIIKYLPSPSQCSCVGINKNTNAIFEANYDFSKAKSAYVFKTMVDPYIGKYSFIKVNSGVLKTDDVLVNTNVGEEEKLGKLFVMQGSKAIEVPELYPGDLGAIAKLAVTKTGDTLSAKSTPVVYPVADISKPYTYMRYTVPKKGEDDKVSQALSKMMAEDMGLRLVNDTANRQQLIYGMGDLHLEVTVSKLKERYKVEIELQQPRVSFRETIKKTSDVEAKYKKQSGGHGQYGHVKMKFMPSGNLEEAYEFDEEVVGGAVPKNYFPAVEKGIQECVEKGPLAGYPVVGVKAVLYDGSYHPVDSSEMAFKTAAVQAFKQGFMEAHPVLLEPVMALKVTVPESYTGDIMGDLNKRRGRVLGMMPMSGNKQVIEAEIPEMSLFGYSTVIRSISGGSATYEVSFLRYEQAPSDIQEKEVAKAAEESKAER